MLICIPLILSSTGYALFSQQLSINASADKPAYSRSQNLLKTYTKTITPSSGKWAYNISVSIKNNGTNGVTAWQSDFSLPNDFTALSCTNATCTQASLTNTAVNTGTNGTISPGDTVTYSFTFTTANQNYLFTSLSISGTPVITYSTISGLTESHSAGTRTKSGNIYTWPYSFTVTNSSGQNISHWRIQCPWDTANNTVASMSTTVDYTQTATQLSIFSKTAVQNGTTFQFSASLTSKSATYVLSGCTIQGQV